MKKFFSLFFTSIMLSGVAQAKDFRFVQVSDVEFSQAKENSEFKHVIQEINEQKDVNFVVFTGDNIAKPKQDDLKLFLKEAKKLNCPFYIVVGDKEINKMKHLGKVDYATIVKKEIRRYKPQSTNYSFVKDDLAFIVVDGTKEVIPSGSGYYKPDTLAWFDVELAKYTDKNIIVFQHFPIIPPSNKESYYTYKPETYMEVVSKYSNIKAIISGHFGVNSEKMYNGINHITTSGLPFFRVVDILDYETPNPTIWAQLKQIK